MMGKLLSINPLLLGRNQAKDHEDTAKNAVDM